MQDNNELFGLFWENSKFSDATIGEFQKGIEEYSGVEHEVPGLQYPGADFHLTSPSDQQFKQMRQRYSSRNFSNKPLSTKQLGSILAAFYRNARNGRTYASAGATYPLEIFALFNNVADELNQKIGYYNNDNHSISVVGELPGWDDYRGLLNIDTAGTMPQLVIVFVLFSDRATIKYGERGGRFALIEVGEAAQNLALRLVQEKLVGCAMGGLLDDKLKALLGLSQTSARIALGVACGYPRT